MFKILTIPFDKRKKCFAEELLNDFVINKQVKYYRAEFFTTAEETYWTVLIEYDEVLEKTPERALHGLNEPQRLLLERLKSWRKERATKDGIPVYLIATNKELMDIVRKAPASIEALKAIKGFGKSKTAKYGEEIVHFVNTFYEKT
jgi:superfamily II DNA helicase RecQ